MICSPIRFHTKGCLRINTETIVKVVTMTLLAEILTFYTNSFFANLVHLKQLAAMALSYVIFFIQFSHMYENYELE